MPRKAGSTNKPKEYLNGATQAVAIERNTIDVAGILVDDFTLDNGKVVYSLTSLSSIWDGYAYDVNRMIEKTERLKKLLEEHPIYKVKLESGITQISTVDEVLALAILQERPDEQSKAFVTAIGSEGFRTRSNGVRGIVQTLAEVNEVTTKVRVDLVNKYIPEYLEGVRDLSELTQAEREVVWKQVGAYRQADNRITNEAHFLKKFNELVGDRRYLTPKELRDVERQAKAYKKEMEAKIKANTHVSVTDYLVS